LERLGKRDRRRLRRVCQSLETLIGPSFLPTPLSDHGVESMLKHGSKYKTEVTDLIVPLTPGPELFDNFPAVQKLHFSNPNVHYFKQLRQQHFPRLRKVTFQSTDGLVIPQQVPQSIEEVVIWGYEVGVVMTTPEKQIIEALVTRMHNLRNLEVWSALHHPDVISKGGANLRRIRLMDGFMASSIAYALRHLTASCPLLEELVITCRAMVAINVADTFDLSSVTIQHQRLAKLRTRHTYMKPIKFVCPNLTHLTLESPQHVQISLTGCPLLQKLRLEASPRTASSIFMRAPPALVSCQLILVSGDPPTTTNHSPSSSSSSASRHARTPSLPITRHRSNSDVSSDGSPTSPREALEREVEKKFEEIALGVSGSISSASSQDPSKQAGVSPSSPPTISKRAGVGHRPVRSGSSRNSDICIRIDSTTMKKFDLRIQTSITSFPKVRDLKLDLPNLEKLTLQIHPFSEAPTDIHIVCPSVTTMSTCLHASLISELFPNFERFPKLKRMFLTLQDEDVLEMGKMLVPFLNWNLPNLEALGLSNISILTGLVVRSESLKLLVLENMHTIPSFLHRPLDEYLPALTHLEIKAPELDNDEEDENEASDHAAGTGPSHQASSHSPSSARTGDPDDENPFLFQREYRGLCPKETITISSYSLKSLVYTLELPHHPHFDLPNLEDILYLQQENESSLHLSKTLNGMPNLNRAYIGVASLHGGNIASTKLRKLKLAFGFAGQNWKIDAPRLEKLKLLRILESRDPLVISLQQANAPRLHHVALSGVVFDELSYSKLPERVFTEALNPDWTPGDENDDDEEEEDRQHMIGVVPH
jgi:hypothetical protein